MEAVARIFTTLVARLEELDEGLPAALWIVVARAGAVLALAMAFRVASRLAGGGLVGAIGGAVAAVTLFLTPDWFQFSAHGSEAPIAVALMLWAIERQLDGRHTQVVVLAALACLLRPELFPFLALYGLWAWWGEPRLRRLLVAVLVLFGVAWAVVRRRRAAVVLGAAALLEVALFLAMTEAGFSGNPRYVLPALATASVLAGVGAPALVEGGAGVSRAARLPRLAGAAVGLAVVAVLGAPFLSERGRQLRSEARQVERRMDTHRDLARAVDEVGGHGAVAAMGTATANRALHPRLAWELGVPMDVVESVIDHRVMFRAGRERLNGRGYMWGRAKSRRTLARVGTIWVYRRDGITFPLARREFHAVGSPFTPDLQGIHTSAKDERNFGARVVTR